MKIPIQLQFKLFDDVFTVKKNVEVLHTHDVAEMYKSVFVPIFGEEAYENMMINIAETIRVKRQNYNDRIIRENKPKTFLEFIKKLFKLK